jgi:hypothetical protein
MCVCTPSRRTPFCGAQGCEWPHKRKPEGVRKETAIPVELRIDEDAMRAYLDKQIREGNIFIRLESGGEIPAENLRPCSFTVDKSRYFVRFDETEEALKITIGPKGGNDER